MIVPARAFLILMVPLLLHGALAGLPHAPTSGGVKNFKWLIVGPEPATDQLAATNLAHTPDVNVPVPSPSLESNLALGTHSYETGDANQPSHDQPPPEPTNHARIEYLDTLPANGCYLPKGTIYRIKSHPAIIYDRPRRPVRRARMAITPQGVMIDIPAGSLIYQSTDPNLINLPASPEQNRIQLHGIQTTCVLPVHTKYTLESSSYKLLDLERPKRFFRAPRSNWVAYTKKGPLLLPAGSTILVSDDPNYMDLPVGNTEVRIVSQRNRKEVEDFCGNIYNNYVPPHGMLSEGWESYMLRCCHINMWLVGHTQLREVDVKPMANMVQLSA